VLTGWLFKIKAMSDFLADAARSLNGAPHGEKGKHETHCVCIGIVRGAQAASVADFYELAKPAGKGPISGSRSGSGMPRLSR
jgi:hypothetical protein